MLPVADPPHLVDAKARVEALAASIRVDRDDDLEARVLREWIHHNGAPLATTWGRIISDRARHTLTNYETLMKQCRGQVEIDLLRGRVNTMIRALHPEVFGS